VAITLYIFYAATRYFLPIIFAATPLINTGSIRRCLSVEALFLRRISSSSRLWVLTYILLIMVALIIVFYPIITFTPINEIKDSYIMAVLIINIVNIIYTLILEPLTILIVFINSNYQVNSIRTILKTIFNNKKTIIINTLILLIMGYVGYNILYLTALSVDTPIYYFTNNILNTLIYVRKVNPEIQAMIKHDPTVLSTSMIPTWGALTAIIILAYYYRQIAKLLTNKIINMSRGKLKSRRRDSNPGPPPYQGGAIDRHNS
jgi:hypothetical protein